MARQKVIIPIELPFQTTMTVRVTDINYGGHLGNDALLGMIQEARLRFLAQSDYSEINLDGVGLIMNDAHINYLGEAFLGNQLLFKVGLDDASSRRFDILTDVTLVQSGDSIAKARTSFSAFNYQTRKRARFSDQVLKRLNGATASK